ncbi:TPA: hypothetical protein QDA90_000721 [Burkholderia vietnamiensis]|nr:hypothetical protein [Burkholderia vietnamiensis]
MDNTALAEIGCAVFGALGSVFAYLWRRSEGQRDRTLQEHGESLTKLNESQSAFELFAARTYVTSHTLETAIGNFNRAVEAIFQKLDKIDDKLDQKVDKR